MIVIESCFWLCLTLSMFWMAVSIGLCVAAWRFARRQHMVQATAEGTVTVIVPAHLGGDPLLRCVNSIALAAGPHVRRVVVVLQDCASKESEFLQRTWSGPCELLMLDQGEVAGKSRAICRGLEVVGTDWVLLVDSDIQLHPGAIDALLAWASGRPAAYGLIASAPVAGDRILASVVISDKFASHGVLRLGRLALGLWPNIPGQCYLIRTDVLRAVYNEEMGHLDDLAVTLKLCGIDGGPACALQILGAEEGRQSWCGLVTQRTRWTIGLVQTLGIIRAASQHRSKMIACWVLHAGLYYGEPLAVCATMLASAVMGRWWVAAAILCGHVLTGLLVSLVGRANVVALDPAHTEKPIPIAYVALGSLVIMGAHCIGAVLAPIMWIAGRSYLRPNARVLYWR